MIELMLLAGTALCAISIVMAVVAVLQTRAPRGAAIALVLGLVLLFATAWMQPEAVTPQNILDVWQRLLSGANVLNPPVSETAPEAAPLSAPGTP